jgi:ketosteroid isomerase-like protein
MRETKLRLPRTGGKMRRLTGIFCAVACLAFSGLARAQSSDPALSKLAHDYEMAWAKGDGVQHGRAELQSRMAANFAGPWKGSTIAIHIGKSQSLGPDMTLNEGTYEVKATGPDGKPMMLKGNYLNTLVKKGGAWMIAGNMAFPPPPPPAAK